MPPMEFHLLNAAEEGTRRPDGPVFPRIGNMACMEAIKGSEHFKSDLERLSPDGKLRGRGMASGYWNGIGNRSTVTINVNDDGVVSLVEGNPDIGGTRTTIAMQAAEVLGLPAGDVHPGVVDTDSIGYNDLTAGSRTTYASGHAAIEAAKLVVEEMKKRVAMVWETEAENIEFESGVFHNKLAPEQRFTFKEAAGKLNSTGGQIAKTGTVNVRGSGGGSFAAHLVDVEVDPETGKVQVIRYTAAQDAGKAVHPVLRGRSVPGRRGAGHRLGAERGVLHERRRRDAQLQLPRLPYADVAGSADARHDHRGGAEREPPVRRTRYRGDEHRAARASRGERHRRRDRGADVPDADEPRPHTRSARRKERQR